MKKEAASGADPATAIWSFAVHEPGTVLDTTNDSHNPIDPGLARETIPTPELYAVEPPGASDNAALSHAAPGGAAQTTLDIITNYVFRTLRRVI